MELESQNQDHSAKAPSSANGETSYSGQEPRRRWNYKSLWCFFRRWNIKIQRRDSKVCSSSVNSEGTPPAIDKQQFFDEKLVYDFVWEYLSAFAKALETQDPKSDPTWLHFWNDYHTPDFLFVRPSGNPLDLKGMMAQFESGDITDMEEDIIMVNSLKALGETAVIVYRSETIFSYKGTKVEDSRTNTIVLVWQDGRPKITSMHKSIGQDINGTR